MKKEKLIELIKKGSTQREIADELDSSQTNVRYWLKKHNLTTIKKIETGKKFCPKCKTTKKVDEFYKKKRGEKKYGLGSYCKICSNTYHSNRVREVKLRMVDYKGGECERCELKLENTHYSVFDFHHIDPNEKDSNFKKIKFQKWDFIKKEIDKCQLVCSNCHREIHAELAGW